MISGKLKDKNSSNMETKRNFHVQLVEHQINCYQQFHTLLTTTKIAKNKHQAPN
jgi:hypothetical protein